ncbi:phosphotransferase [Virgibacillus sp. DJP39]|uniref:phosphotransferase n=1 Tax=Virgibacillus sp. DJP39 TaxID=3409790 RepID=UPI003BB73394
MENLLRAIDWKKNTAKLKDLLEQTELNVEYLNQGNEAEVVKVSILRESFVLKSWNLESRPNVEFQYLLLNALAQFGVPVSNAVGWGTNHEGYSVLLTTYDGPPVLTVSEAAVTKFAAILVDIHCTPYNKLAVTLPSYEFIILGEKTPSSRNEKGVSKMNRLRTRDSFSYPLSE